MIRVMKKFYVVIFGNPEDVVGVENIRKFREAADLRGVTYLIDASSKRVMYICKIELSRFEGFVDYLEECLDQNANIDIVV